MRAIIVVEKTFWACLFIAHFTHGWGNIIFLFLQKYIIGTVEKVLLFSVLFVGFP